MIKFEELFESYKIFNKICVQLIIDKLNTNFNRYYYVEK